MQKALETDVSLVWTKDVFQVVEHVAVLAEVSDPPCSHGPKLVMRHGNDMAS